MATEYLFVYGTLRRDVDHPAHETLREKATYIGDGFSPGKLFDLGEYPGMVPADAEADANTQRVRGEVYALQRPTAGEALAKLDRYEECGPGFPEPTEYVRREVDVYLDDHRQLRAWTYIYNFPLNGFQCIADGDYLQTERNPR